MSNTITVSPGSIPPQGALDIPIALAGANGEAEPVFVAAPAGPLDSSWRGLTWAAWYDPAGGGTLFVRVVNGGSLTATPIPQQFYTRRVG